MLWDELLSTNSLWLKVNYSSLIMKKRCETQYCCSELLKLFTFLFCCLYAVSVPIFSSFMILAHNFQNVW